MSDYECPKCGATYEAVGSHEEDAGEHECEDCGFKFIVEIEYEPCYSTRCVVHEWVELERGSVFTFWQCEHCGAVDSDSVVDHRAGEEL